MDRSSDVVEMAKDTQNPVGCIHCHDPHGTQPRVVRDALIQAVADDPEQNILPRRQDRFGGDRLPWFPQDWGNEKG